ncbi:MAG: GNAT family N-acetyltransferase [Thermoanaerobaculia bacterium]
MQPPIDVTTLERARLDDAVDVICDAFHDYPAMRFFLAATGSRYERHLRLLVGFFTEARFLRGDPVLGIELGGELAAVAYVVKPDTLAPPALEEHRERLWAELGAAARARYEAFGRATASFPWPAEPHHDLSLIGVRRRLAGRGLARPLMDAVHQMSASDPCSSGVGLTTELPKNLALYEHFGYRRIGHAQLPGLAALETWGLFRQDPITDAVSARASST